MNLAKGLMISSGTDKKITKQVAPKVLKVHLFLRLKYFMMIYYNCILSSVGFPVNQLTAYF